jgi:hypothetical protein
VGKRRRFKVCSGDGTARIASGRGPSHEGRRGPRLTAGGRDPQYESALTTSPR